jgi:nitrogen regulatory protein PII
MKAKGYVLFVVLSNAKNLKAVLKCLKKINIKGATVVDSVGSASLYSSDDIFIPMIASSMKNIDSSRTYGKTLFSVIKDEDTVIKAMDAIECTLNIDIQNPGKGIMFSIPIYAMKGIIEH